MHGCEVCKDFTNLVKEGNERKKLYLQSIGQLPLQNL